MATLPKPWPQTWPTSTDCQFSVERAEANARYLEAVFGKPWVEKGVQRQWAAKEHPVVSAWRWGGGEHFLQLNALAEDLRLVENTPGFAGVLRELKQPKDYYPTRHMLRAAALIKRGGNALTKFFPAGSDTVPDFEVMITGTRVPVEAKLLTQSQPWRDFCTKAVDLRDAVIRDLYPDGSNHPVTMIVVKKHDEIPSCDDVIREVAEARKKFDGHTSEHRGSLVNVFLSAPPGASHADFVSVQIATPRSDAEEQRVEHLVKRANRQLRNNAKEAAPGLLCVSITEHQDPHTLVRWLSRKFADQQFRSISGVLLHRPASHRGPPPIVVLDQLAFVQNPNAFVALPEFQMTAIGAAPGLLDNPPPPEAISCYGVGIVRSRILSGNNSIGLNVPKVLLPEALE